MFLMLFGLKAITFAVLFSIASPNFSREWLVEDVHSTLTFSPAENLAFCLAHGCLKRVLFQASLAARYSLQG